LTWREDGESHSKYNRGNREGGVKKKGEKGKNLRPSLLRRGRKG